MKKVYLLIIFAAMLCISVSAQSVRTDLDLTNRTESANIFVEDGTVDGKPSVKVGLGDLEGDNAYVVFKGLNLSGYQLLAFNYSLTERVSEGAVTIMIGNDNGDFALSELNAENNFAFEQPSQGKVYSRFFDLAKLSAKGIDLSNAHLVVAIAGSPENVDYRPIEDIQFGITLSHVYAATAPNGVFDLLPGFGYYNQATTAPVEEAWIGLDIPKTTVSTQDGMFFGSSLDFNRGKRFADFRDFDEIEAEFSCPADNIGLSFILRFHIVKLNNADDLVGAETQEFLETLTFTDQTIKWKFNFADKAAPSKKIAAVKFRAVSGAAFNVTVNSFTAKTGSGGAGIQTPAIKNNPNEIVNVYNLLGTLVRKSVKASEATLGLQKGLYIVGNKKVLVTK